MKLTIVALIASILIIGLADFSDATFFPLPLPGPCGPVSPPKPPVKPPQPPVKPPKPPVKPPVNPCNPCGPGGVTCAGCQGRDNLCEDLIKTIRDLDAKIKKCVCGVKFI